MVRIILLLVLFSLIGASVAQADSLADQFQIGAVYEGSIKVSRTQTPLPPGKWTIGSYNENRTGNGVVLGSLVLTKIINNKFMSYVVIKTNVDISRNGWISNKYCDRNNVYFSQTDSNYQKDQSCWIINHVIMNATNNFKPDYGSSIREILSKSGSEMPRTMISTIFHLANDHSFITYEILINPEYYGFPQSMDTNWANSHWHKDLIGKDPKRQQFLEQIKAQHSPIYSTLKAQFN